MRNRAKRRETKQAGEGLLLTAQQLLLPMIDGMARSKQALLEWVQQVGLSALGELFERDAEQLAGPKGKHSKERSHYRWGSAPAELPFGGRRIVVSRPRVRNLVGGEEQLHTVEHFQRIDPVPARVLNQILLGVSTRGYAKSLEPSPVGVAVRGTSKTTASRHLIARMTDKLREQLTRRLDDLDLLVLMLDGVEVARRTVVVALGILADGRKVVLGLWLGSTENAALSTALLQNLLERGLKGEGRTLCVIDGGRGLRKAHVAHALSAAWASDSAELARRRLKTLLQWLERNGENGAAASLREGMEETLTVLKLELPTALRGFLVTTNAIENLIGSARRTSRNVTRWRSGDMISRWAAVGLLQAEEHFRRIRGYRHLPLLKRALRADASKLDATEEAA